MKKLLFTAAAAVALLATSCSKDGVKNGAPSTNESEKATLAIHLPQMQSSKAIEQPATSTAVTLNDGYIFIVSTLGNIEHKEALKVDEAKSPAGQRISEKVSADAKVWVVGNIPSADYSELEVLTTLDEVKKHTVGIETQADYTAATLSNKDGEAESIVVDDSDGSATVTVQLAPAIARMELPKVQGSGNITGFTVVGVYLDEYYPSFTMDGGVAGEKYNMGTSKDQTLCKCKDEGNWDAFLCTTNYVANPESSSTATKVWAHNVAAGALPRFIIKLKNVTYTDGDGNAVDLGETPHYLTVTGYAKAGAAIDKIKAGEIFSVGGEDGIVFDEDDLSLVPNPGDVTLNVKVEVLDWVIVTPDVVL